MDEYDKKQLQVFFYRGESDETGCSSNSSQEIFQIYGQKIQQLRIHRNEKDNEMIEISKEPFKLINPIHLKDTEMNVQNNFKVKPESLIFKEDDRHERPFVVLEFSGNKIKNIWFTIFNMQV